MGHRQEATAGSTATGLQHVAAALQQLLLCSKQWHQRAAGLFSRCCLSNSIRINQTINSGDG